MTAPAVVQVRDALAAMLAQAVPTSRIIIDRPRADDIDETEVPCIVISFGDLTFDFFEQRSTIMHQGQFELEVFHKPIIGGLNIAIQQYQTVALICAAVLADYTLGGRLQNMMPKGVSPPDSNASDIGGVALTIETTWFTAPDDFNTIV